jgi:hypothetical protein
MPDAAFIAGKASCPAYGRQVLDGLRCQWGALPLAEYALGDEVRWLRDTGGSIVPPYVLIDVSPGVRRWNCGDPQVSNVNLFDLDVNPGNGPAECTASHARIAAAVAIVRRGVFREVRAIDDAEVDRILGPSRGKADIVMVREDGSHWPREDWYDKTIEYRPGHGPAG